MTDVIDRHAYKAGVTDFARDRRGLRKPDALANPFNGNNTTAYGERSWHLGWLEGAHMGEPHELREAIIRLLEVADAAHRLSVEVAKAENFENVVSEAIRVDQKLAALVMAGVWGEPKTMDAYISE